MKENLVIFDMGNTLINFHLGVFSDDDKDLIGLTHLSYFLKSEYDISISVKELKLEFLEKWYGDFYLRKEKLIELDFGKYLKLAIDKREYSNKEIDYIKCMKTWYKQYVEDSVAIKDGLEILKYLKNKNYTIKVISNCIVHDSVYIESFKNHGLDKYIDEYIFSYSRKIRKPNISLFKEATSNYSGKIEDAFMIGDNITADIEPAQSLGMKGIWLKRKENTTNISPYKIIEKFDELFEIL